MKNLIAKVAAAAAITIFTGSYVTSYVLDNEYHSYPAVTPATFTQGEVLTPDYVHQDTLIVVNASLLNSIFETEGPATDQEINNALARTTAVKK